MVAKPYREAIEQFLSRHVSDLLTHSFGPKTAGLALGELRDYPKPTVSTWVTIGLAEQERSLWRGLPLGHELVLTLAESDDDVVDMVKSVVVEDRRDRGRRAFIEHNGVWAPGYPPHLVFLDSPAVPDLDAGWVTRQMPARG